MTELSIIVAVSDNGVIGLEGGLPWTLPEDLRRFAELTKGNAVIMGRKTHESILEHLGHPLTDRQSIVVTRQPNYEASGCVIANSLPKALALLDGERKAFIIGGAQLYEQALPLVGRIYLTHVRGTVSGDTTFPYLSDDLWEVVDISEEYPADNRHTHPYIFRVIERREQK